MQIKPIISALAISLTMAVAGPAFAETTINGTAISAEDVPAVQERCDQITAAAATPNTIADENNSDGNANSADASGGAAATSDQTKENDGASETATPFDLGTLNAESCATLTTK